MSKQKPDWHHSNRAKDGAGYVCGWDSGVAKFYCFLCQRGVGVNHTTDVRKESTSN